MKWKSVVTKAEAGDNNMQTLSLAAPSTFVQVLLQESV